MARILENISKGLLEDEKIAVPKFKVAENPQEAVALAQEIGYPVVLKALVPVGKRGKAGAIKFADNSSEVEQFAKELFQMRVRSYPVYQVLIEQKIDIKEELYLSMTIDKNMQQPVIIASVAGGVDVEELSRTNPEKVVTYPVKPILGLADFEARQIWASLGVTGKLISQLGAITKKLYQAFVKYDAYLLEINPLVITGEGIVMAAASVMSVDDCAMFRHQNLQEKVQMGTERAWRPLTDLEKQVVAVNEADPYRGTARYTEMDGGEIGFMCGGGGGSLLLFDALVQAGGTPANYSEFGGNPSEDKVCGLTKAIIAKDGVKGLFVAQNITNNTQVDVVAKGVVRALTEMNIDPKKFPVVVREAGVNELEARRIFSEAGVEYYGDEVTLTEAAQRMVNRMRESYPGYGEQEVI
ncbi:MAG: ATP-grasp domain-containing protein [Bacillota bacterium]|nr:ATP-grasp domain-containing protein [Bacillota bacterium]